MLERRRYPTLELGTFPRLMAVAIATRFIADTATQLFLPFLPLIAAGLGVDVIALGRLVSLRSAMGILSPIFGSLADQFGYRWMMRLGLLMSALGLLLVGASTRLWVAAVGMVVMGLGLSGFVPTLQAYMSSRLPYERRAQGLGILEYSWALAGIVGLSLIGQLIAVAGWRAPFFVLSGGLWITWVVFAGLPPGGVGRSPTPRPVEGHWRRRSGQLRAFFDLGENRRSAWGVILVNGVSMFALIHVMVIYGGWLQKEYSLGPAALGMVALLAGVADLGGSVLVSLVTDRLGKRRSVLLGNTATLGAYVLLPFLNVGLVPAVASIALVRFCFEYSIVSTLPLISEQVPEQRGKVMTLGAACGLTGVTLAGLTGPWFYTQFGVWGLGPVSAAMSVVVLLLLHSRVREGGR